MMTRLPRIAGVLYAALLLAGCGGGDSGATSPLANGGGSTDPIGGDESPPEAIQGIAPPSGVAVVTATNVD
jgi:hypothetical protein